MPEHVFINLNLAIVKFREKGSRGIHVHSHKFTCMHQNHENGFFHRLTAPYLLGCHNTHTFINFNLCCIQWFKSHVYG